MFQVYSSLNHLYMVTYGDSLWCDLQRLFILEISFNKLGCIFTAFKQNYKHLGDPTALQILKCKIKNYPKYGKVPNRHIQ